MKVSEASLEEETKENHFKSKQDVQGAEGKTNAPLRASSRCTARCRADYCIVQDLEEVQMTGGQCVYDSRDEPERQMGARESKIWWIFCIWPAS